MERNEQRRADILDRRWDDIQRGAESGQPANLDATSLAIIDRLAAPRTSQEMDAAYQRVRRLIIAPVIGTSDGSAVAGPTLAVATWPRSWEAVEDQSPSRWRLALTPAAILALIALAAVLGYLAFGQDNDRPRATVPAAVDPATPAVPTPTPLPAITETLLFDFTLPASAIPTGEGVGAGFAHFTIPPGTRSTWEPPCCPGPLFEYVMSGVYTVRATAAVKVMRADGSLEEIPANVEVVLQAGDTLISDNGTVVETANDGSVPVEMLGWVLVVVGNWGGHQLPGWIAGQADLAFDMSIGSGDGIVTISEVTLDPLAIVLPPDEGSFQFYIERPEGVSGTPMVYAFRELPEGLLNGGSRPATIYLLRFEQEPPPAGTPEPATPPP